ncbi:MAG: DUF4339 domain-containing protein [Kiritimatiellae bacterium]|nr:DUF4339 domain-containing protein [Kiritimatiellia bacterium]
MDWYYVIDGTQHGPVSKDALRGLLVGATLTPDDLVWTASMGKVWKKISAVPELDAQRSPPPPFGETSPPHESGSDPAIPYTGEISCTAPAGTAWESMKFTLFRPFSLGKWFMLGFSAWLAMLGQNGGSAHIAGFGNPISGGFTSFDGPSETFDPASLAPALAEMWSSVRPYIALAIPVLILCLGIGAMLIWIQSRGKFMFLDNLVNNRTEVKKPWEAYAGHANALFLWSILYGLVCFVIFGLAFAGLVVTVLIPFVQNRAFTPSMVAPIIGFGLLFFVLAIIDAYIRRFLNDFVVPLMYKSNLKTTEAWRQFLNMAAGNWGALLVYGLMYAVLCAAWSIGLMVIGVAACCLGLIVSRIPYVCAVYALPMTTYLRFYSLQYLAQFGPEYRMQAEAHQSTLP